MFFSVIVPIYNVESYLRQCLDSLASQTCMDFEAVLVDDGSEDASGIICDEYTARYDNFTVIHQKNQGLSAARNAGMAAASGDWLVFVDSDDWVDQSFLEIIQEHLLASKADLCRLSFETVNESGEKKRDYPLSKEDLIYSFPDERARFNFYFEIAMTTVRVWGGAYRRSIIEEHDLRFVSEKKVYAEDMLFNFQYMLFVQKIIYLKDILYHYRKRPGSLTDTTGFEERIKRVEYLAELTYQSMAAENLPLFKKDFYQLYFKILNRFIMRDAVRLDDAQLRVLLDKLNERKFHRKYLAQIRCHDKEFRQYTQGRNWYRKAFGKVKPFSRQVANQRLAELATKHPLFWRIIFFNDDLYYRFHGKHAFPPVYQRDNERKVEYLSMPKAACSSITVSMLRRDDIPDDYSMWYLRRPYTYQKPATEEGWFTFTFVRDPFERMVSCYESKYHRDRINNSRAIKRGYYDFDRYLYGYMKEDKGFEYFVDQVVSIPWRLDNKHFASQYRRITDKNGKLLVDYIGKVEHLEEEYEPIREKYDFAPLKVYNKSEHGDWRDYYTTDLAKKVYRKYKKDVQYFGYEQDYKDLLEYCRQRGK